MEGKRKRSPNFSQFETDVLIDIITKYKEIIENKKTDGTTIKEKDGAWKKIEADFNSVGGKASSNFFTIFLLHNTQIIIYMILYAIG